MTLGATDERVEVHSMEGSVGRTMGPPLFKNDLVSMKRSGPGGYIGSCHIGHINAKFQDLDR